MEPNIVFVCYETDKYSGIMIVKNVVDRFELAKEFKLLSQEDKISRSVQVFSVNVIARDFFQEFPPEIINQLKELEQL